MQPHYGWASFSLPSPATLASAIVVGLVLIVVLMRRSGKDSKQYGGATGASSASHQSARASAAPADTRARCTILFGTQTGTAERFAKSLRAQLEGKYGGTTAFEVLDIEQYDFAAKLPREKLAVLLMATYGDGDPTDSATDFWTWLSAAADSGDDPDLLQGVSFAVFGLGNRQYEHFCAMGCKVSKAMRGLGAAEVVPRGEGDDDRDIDEDFDKWSGELFGALDSSELVTKSEGGTAAGMSAGFVAAYDVEVVADAPPSAVDRLPTGGSGHSSHSPFLATVAAVRELHTGGDRSCVHVELDTTGCQASYEAGDHVAVFAENSPAVVEAAARLLGLPLSHCFRLRVPSPNKHSLPEPAVAGPLTLRCALARYADLLSAPNKAALLALAACAADKEEAAKLQRLASIEGKDEYHSYVVGAKRSLLEVMQDFPSARPSLGAFFGSIAPHLQPRYYSISSAPEAHPRAVHITCAVVKEATPTGRVHEGVASCWLQRARPGQQVPIFLRTSTFKLPADPAVPVVMVGPGTGLAPFRGFLQRRAALAKSGRKLGPAHLFFGCRNRKHDFLYEEELEGAVAGGALSQLHVAFSRERAQKEYVQHHMEAHAAEVWAILCGSAGGYLYVCGDAKNMAKDVHRTLHTIAIKASGCSSSQAEAQIKALSDSGRYLKDVW